MVVRGLVKESERKRSENVFDMSICLLSRGSDRQRSLRGIRRGNGREMCIMLSSAGGLSGPVMTHSSYKPMCRTVSSLPTVHALRNTPLSWTELVVTGLCDKTTRVGDSIRVSVSRMDIGHPTGLGCLPS